MNKKPVCVDDDIVRGHLGTTGHLTHVLGK